MSKIFKQFKEGLITNNPVFIQFLGMCCHSGADLL